MTSKRLYFLMLAIVGLLIAGLLGGAYAVTSLLTSESKQLVSNRLNAEVLSQEQTDLVNARTEVQRYQQLATIAKSVVPADKDQAQTVGQIVAIAGANGINLSSISFPASTLGNGTKSGSPDLSQLTPVKEVAGVYALPLTLTSDSTKPVAYSKFISFLSALEHNRRTALVQSITIQPNDKDRSTLSFTLLLNEYIKP